eukprot:3940651-Rhodomonas_salina.9
MASVNSVTAAIKGTTRSINERNAARNDTINCWHKWRQYRQKQQHCQHELGLTCAVTVGPVLVLWPVLVLGGPGFGRRPGFCHSSIV